MRLEFLLQDGAHTLGILLLVPFDLGAAEEGFELGVYVSNMLVGHFICVRGCFEYFTNIGSNNTYIPITFTDEETETERG